MNERSPHLADRHERYFSGKNRRRDDYRSLPDGLGSGPDIFYREAGRKENPTLLLLHGFPTSSHMFRDLIPLLADRFHVVAPDYPGFGNSATPDVTRFEYTFDHLAAVMDEFVKTLKLDRYALYLQDFGGPVGFRLAARHPERVRALFCHPPNAVDGHAWMESNPSAALSSTPGAVAPCCAPMTC